jgi:hypothetical protein
MGFFKWLKREGTDRRLIDWRNAWAAAAAAPDRDAAQALRVRLDALAIPEEEIEIEREMLEGLNAVIELAGAVARSGLPAVVTGHRIIGADICHFTAPASMPDDPAQPSGRLILTSARAIFVGGRGLTVAWHAIGRTLASDRDLLLVRTDGTSVYRFRCNSFADAMCGAFLARRLVAARRPAEGAETSRISLPSHDAEREI